MKKLILSLAMVMTMILVSTTESKAIIEVTFTSGTGNCGDCSLWSQIKSCTGAGNACTWKIGVLANPQNINLNKPIQVQCDILKINDKVITSAPTGYVLDFSVGKSIYDPTLKCYINLKPGQYKAIAEKSFIFDIVYTLKPIYN